MIIYSNFCTKEAIENHHSSPMLHDCMCHILVDMYGMLVLLGVHAVDWHVSFVNVGS